MTKGIQHNRNLISLSSSISSTKRIGKSLLQIRQGNFGLLSLFEKKWSNFNQEHLYFWHTRQLPSPKLFINTDTALCDLPPESQFVFLKHRLIYCRNSDAYSSTVRVWSCPHINTSLAIKMARKIFDAWMYGVSKCNHTKSIEQDYPQCQVKEVASIHP